MKKSTLEAYAEVDSILNLMNKEYVQAIPIKIRELFKKYKDKKYAKIITTNKPLTEQKLSYETLTILAVLNYNYWCKDENRKKELLRMYSLNEFNHQEDLKKIYNANDIFKNEKEKAIISSLQSNNGTMIESKKERWYKKIFNQILVFFRIK